MDIQTCKHYREFVTTNFQLKLLLNFLDVGPKIREKELSDLDNRKKIRKITQVGRKISVQEKKVKKSVFVVLAQNLFYDWCLFYTNISSEISIEK